ncbi:MAG: ABC transporter ATP-binding protein [Clostridiales bacterium]|nr:ABC transporter ATP-binding protein [Clostridiales bacterium]
MLDVNHVTKKYGKNLACDDVSFLLENGSLTVLLGPNGAGKSTIIKSIIGFLKYDGRITVNGIPNKTSQARKIMGYIPELPSLYPTLTVIEHMEFIARAYKMTNYKERIDMLLERFELADKKKKFGDELSKGMQQKLNLCIGLLPDPDILLMDEPLLGLDPHAIKELKLMIEEMRQAGKTMLISTHIIDSVDMLWDRTVIMQNGKVRANVTRSEIEGQGKSLEDLFFEVTEGLEPSSVKALAPEVSSEPSDSAASPDTAAAPVAGSTAASAPASSENQAASDAPSAASPAETAKGEQDK